MILFRVFPNELVRQCPWSAGCERHIEQWWPRDAKWRQSNDIAAPARTSSETSEDAVEAGKQWRKKLSGEQRLAYQNWCCLFFFILVFWRGRFSAVDLLLPNSLYHLLFYIETTIKLFYKTSYLNEDVSCTEPSPSVNIPC